MNYRADIDGLRAVAVLMVVFYHAGFSFIPGGFIGVDVFFVISGYLITGIIYREIQDGTFTFSNFYTRRIKRILPAFYVVGFATLSAGYLLLLPSDYVNLAKSFLSASAFIGNVFFWWESGGYFSGAADEMPLLHTWSLSVEEQFYFLWPIALLTAYKFLSKKNIILLTIVIIVVSFSLAEFMSRQLSVLISGASYFLLPTKAGEILLGALLALHPEAGNRISKVTSNILAVAGVGLMIIPSLILTKESIFPGVNSFLPCLGTVLIILTGRFHQTPTHKLLSSKPLVFIGLISYSLYLWHWPVNAYVRYLQYEFTTKIGISMILVSILMAYLSWKYVEKPTRYAKGFKLVMSRYLIAPIAICTLAVIFVNQTEGFSNRLEKNTKYSKVKESIKGPSVKNGWCHDTKTEYKDCILGDDNGQINALLWGDSHGGTYSPFIDAIAKELEIKVTPLTFSSCTPFVVDKGNGADVQLCKKSRDYVLDSLKAKKYDVIFIAARVDSMLRSYRLNISDYFDAIEFASKYAKKVIVLAQVPVFNSNMSSILLRETFLNDIMNKGSNNIEVNHWVNLANNKLSGFIKSFPNVDIIDITYLFEKDGLYSPIKNNVLLYSDTNHLNIKGAQYLGQLFINSENGSSYIRNLKKQLIVL